jgi:triosephosphate isomerase (TIM)
MKQKIIVANWKMNPMTPKEAVRIFTGTMQGVAKIKGVQVVVCPPTIFLGELSKVRKATKVRLGVQDMYSEDAGAYTGQTASPMILAYKASVAILGHSERRALGESHALVGEKVRHAIRKGFTPILCVGERERNDEGAHFTYVREELEAVFMGLKRAELAQLIIAYEPVWAIGKSATDAMQTRDLYEMTLYIRKLLIERFGRANADLVSIVYGGSVKADNAAAFVRDGGVDGLLVGSASLDPKQFSAIVTSVATL